MYEENLKPLPAGDAMAVFGEVLAPLAARLSDMSETDEVARGGQWADRSIQPYFDRVCRRLLLPGSQIEGLENLVQLAAAARQGHSCLICFNHRSTLDVPTLAVLLEDAGRRDLFDQIVWIAGRKLSEDSGLTKVFIQAVNRVMVTPPSWLDTHYDSEERHRAREVNLAAHRAMHDLRHQGWIFGLFPAGTRIRPDDEATQQALPETDSYLRHFQKLLLCRIDGCTLPVSRSQDLTHEVPCLDRVTFQFGPVLDTQAWRNQIWSQSPGMERREATAAAIMEQIEQIGLDSR